MTPLLTSVIVLISVYQILFQISWKGANVAKINGLSLLLDAETFEYSHPLEIGEGFKISIHHHFDRPTIALQVLHTLGRADGSRDSVVKVTRVLGMWGRECLYIT